jgi:hypothetical protein
MSIISFPHSFLRNFILYFGPFVILSAVIVLNLPNPSVHKNALNQNNFYSQISTEMKTLEVKIDENSNGQTNQIAKTSGEVYNNLVWKTVGKNLASPEWVKGITETNLDRTGVWLSGKTDKLELYYPQDQVNAAVQKEITSTQNNATSNQITENLNAIGGFFNNQLEKIKQDTTVQNIINQATGTTAQIGENINNITEPWQKLPLTIRSYFLTLQSFIWTALTLYIVAIIALILTSPLFGKNPIIELLTIARNLGFSTLSASVFMIAGLSFGFLSTIFLKPFLPAQLQLPNILNILGWQGIWSSIWVLSPALVVSLMLIGVGILTPFFKTKNKS